MKTDHEFFMWLAGFIDGEGCFTIQKRTQSYVTRLVVKLRDDDEAILREIHRRTGLGRIYYIAAAGTSERQVSWQVESKADCPKLIALLDRYRLEAKKASDYAIWREAVQVWQEHRYGSDWGHMEALKERLSAVRAYRGEALGQCVEPGPAQLRLVDDEEMAA